MRLWFASISILCLSGGFASAAAESVTKPSDVKSSNLTIPTVVAAQSMPDSYKVPGALAETSKEIAKIFSFYDCDKQFPPDTAEVIVGLCTSAGTTPHTRQDKSLTVGEKDRGAKLHCTFDGETFSVAVESKADLPIYVIDKKGHLLKIIRDELFVTAKTCQGIFTGKKSKIKKLKKDEEPELCFQYYTGPKADPYRSAPACAERRTASDDSKGPDAEPAPDAGTDTNPDAGTAPQEDTRSPASSTGELPEYFYL